MNPLHAGEGRHKYDFIRLPEQTLNNDAARGGPLPPPTSLRRRKK